MPGLGSGSSGDGSMIAAGRWVVRQGQGDPGRGSECPALAGGDGGDSVTGQCAT